MRLGYIIMIGGAVFLVAGIAVAVYYGSAFVNSFGRDNRIIEKTSLAAGQSLSEKKDVTQTDRQLALTLRVDRSDGQQKLGGVLLNESITDPGGQVVSNNEFRNVFVTSVKTTSTGAYTATITNVGTAPVTVGGTFGYIPFIGSDGLSTVNELLGGRGLGPAIAGGFMAFAGAIGLAIGGMVTVADLINRHKARASTAGAGGISYTES